MKNRNALSCWAFVFLMLTVVLAFFSWIASIYGWEPIQSLLSEEGIRWMLNHAVTDYAHHPVLGNTLVLLMGLGIGVHGGFYHALARSLHRKRQLSGRERRSLMLSVVVGTCYVGMVLCFLPFLKSVTGTFVHSPLYNGFFYLLSVGLGLMGTVYGFASNNYSHVSHVFNGMTHLIARYAGYWVTLFFIILFFTAFGYTHMAEWLRIDGEWTDSVCLICCCLPLLHLLFYDSRRS